MLHVLVISLIEHSWNKIKSDYGCPKKKRKDGMPKKHDQKKGEKKGVTMSQKRERERETGMIRERKAITSRSKPYPSIHPSTHTLAPSWILSLTLQ